MDETTVVRNQGLSVSYDSDETVKLICDWEMAVC